MQNKIDQIAKKDGLAVPEIENQSIKNSQDYLTFIFLHFFTENCRLIYFKLNEIQSKTEETYL